VVSAEDRSSQVRSNKYYELLFLPCYSFKLDDSKNNLVHLLSINFILCLKRASLYKTLIF
jgi:hypothetical protein